MKKGEFLDISLEKRIPGHNLEDSCTIFDLVEKEKKISKNILEDIYTSFHMRNDERGINELILKNMLYLHALNIPI